MENINYEKEQIKLKKTNKETNNMDKYKQFYKDILSTINNYEKYSSHKELSFEEIKEIAEAIGLTNIPQSK